MGASNGSTEVTALKQRLAEDAAFARDVRTLHERYDELLATHPRSWVGIFDGEVRGVADTLEELIELLTDRGVPPGFTAVEYLDPEPPLLIL
jgi:hypothetical protein